MITRLRHHQDHNNGVSTEESKPPERASECSFQISCAANLSGSYFLFVTKLPLMLT
jgi:hypothetical protein